MLVKRPGQGFVPLTASQQVPVGSLLDTSHGTVRLTSAANSRGAVQTGDFTGGVFGVGQSRTGGGLTDLKLSGGNFRACVASTGKRAVAALSSRVVRRLRGRAHGRFRDPWALQRGDGPRHQLDRGGPLRRHAHARADRDRVRSLRCS